MRKIGVLLLAGMMLAGTLMGCGNQSSGGAGTTEAGGTTVGSTTSGETKTLEVVWFSDGKEGESFRRLADEYEEANSGIKIEMIEVPYNDLDNKIKGMINGNEAPALARLTNMGTFQNQLLDLGEYISDKDEFINSFGEGLRFVYDDRILGAPMDVTANGLIYNKTAFEKAGVEVPQSEDEVWTWEEWKEAMEKVVEGSDCSYGLVYDYSPNRFSTLLFQAGGGLLNEDLTESDFNTPENKRAVEFFKELHDEEIIPSTVWLGAENPNNMFRTGQVAMHLSGSWNISNYRNEITDFEWGVTYLPKDKVRSSVPGGKWISAFKGSGVEQEAADFIEWISQPEQNARYCEENLFLSQVKGNEVLNYDYGSEFFTIFAQELAASSKRPGAEWGYQTFTGLVQTDIREQLVEVLAGNMSVDEYLSSIDALFTETLKDME
jgi:ABC-type sugar transport system, periplasmic component